MKAKENLYLNHDKTKIVLEDSPDQAYTFVIKGGEIPAWAIEQFGLTEAKDKGQMPPLVPTKSQSATEKKLKAGGTENK